MISVLARMLWLVSVAAFFIATTVDAGEEEVEIINASIAEMDIIRKGTLAAKLFLRECGLATTGRQRVVVTRDLLRENHLQSFAQYNSDKQTITILALDVLPEMVKKDDVYAMVPLTGLYASLVAHEVAHAVVFRNLQGRTIQRTAHEFIAYVVQFHSLEDKILNRLAATFMRTVWAMPDSFNELMLYFAPHEFGLQAYMNFVRDDRGCRLILDILAERVLFPTLEHTARDGP